ncbi:hypothetical protein LAZ40_09715 [Cereibacter sphaeroides]|uniref:hypothetical protein n=1 Tax=Cereibacter sphaeroides TaxID=1063 RepID=UPI001F3E3042|nr:hypothetical protein [Cereibacter sphaeroides]MCE6959327.1 hypothetical protein [Cereibacter sphaeroides]MCE6972919.1 hypothetical protein [Cereibacter sphaeroides]
MVTGRGAGSERLGREEVRDRLAALPGAVTVPQICAGVGIPQARADQYLARWAEAGLVARFGAGVFLNLVRDPEAEKTQPGLALALLLQRPFIMVGGAALYHTGWTGQVHRRIEIAVPVTRTTTGLPAVAGGFVLVPRFPRHHQILMENLASNASGWEGIPVARPAFALADSLLASTQSVPASSRTFPVPPDEIDPDLLECDETESFRDALKALGAAPALLERAMGDYGAALRGPSAPAPHRR